MDTLNAASTTPSRATPRYGTLVAMAVAAVLMAACGHRIAAIQTDGTTGGTGTGGSTTGGSTSGSSGSTTSGTGGAAEACQTLATNVCNDIAACGGTAIVGQFGDEATCVARAALECEGRLKAVGTGASVEQVVDCARALQDAGCSDASNNSLLVLTGAGLFHYGGGTLPMDGIPACQYTGGSLSVGSACFYDEQCASNLCSHVWHDDACGQCATALQQGASCQPNPKDAPTQRCGAGLACPRGSCVPVLYGALGAPCGPEELCDSSLYCDQGSCTPRKAEGEGCSLLFGECEGLCFCDPVAKRCEQVPLSQPGEHCYPIGSDGGSGCTNRSSCNPDGFVCVAAVWDGQPCGGASGAPCVDPAWCVAGTCHLPVDLVCTGGAIDGSL